MNWIRYSKNSLTSISFVFPFIFKVSRAAPAVPRNPSLEQTEKVSTLALGNVSYLTPQFSCQNTVNVSWYRFLDCEMSIAVNSEKSLSTWSNGNLYGTVEFARAWVLNSRREIHWRAQCNSSQHASKLRKPLFTLERMVDVDIDTYCNSTRSWSNLSSLCIFFSGWTQSDFLNCWTCNLLKYI